MLGALFERCLHIDPTVETADALVSPPQPLPTCKGVVLFADAEERCVSMLTATNIRRTAMSRLFAGPDASGKRGSIAPVVRFVYYQCCFNDFEAALKYLQAARLLWPDSWRSMMSLPKLWYVRIDLSAKWPNFAITEKFTASAGWKVFGPFPTRRSANRYVTALRTAFALCHRPDLVDSPEKAATCPYLQMGACPAPCVGNLSRQDYRRQLEDAVIAAGGRFVDLAENLRRRMMAFASDRQFEQAATLKKRIEALNTLTGRDYIWTHDLSQLAILHIDRWARVAPQDGGKRKVQTYAGYCIVHGRVHRLDPVPAEQTDAMCKATAEVLHSHNVEHALNSEARDNLAVVAGFIYRNNPPGIWIDVSAEGGQYRTPSPEDVATRIQDKFAKGVKPSPENSDADA